MGKGRLRQLADSIHDTIYLSELESLMASSAAFYRLHDVYQSSTVYMTFPSNRTKRYEHSLGTMQLASEMFYYGVTNAEKSVIDQLLSDLQQQYSTLWKSILDKKQAKRELVYGLKEISNVVACYMREREDAKKTAEKAALFWAVPDERALSHYIPTLPANDARDPDCNHFLFVSLLEAIRIAALFHDVGHPPFSHIIENALNQISNEIKAKNNKNRTQRERDYISLLSSFNQKSTKKRYLCAKSREKKETSANHRELHEAIGLSLLERTFHDCYKKLHSPIPTSYWRYYLTVYEFAFAILEEKSQFWASLHRIIDGPFDADRLDYILRDTRNSGVNWGGIPYKRIVESAKLDHSDANQYHLAFPQKIAEDIDDILLIRFKIFTRINANHRCVKTAKLLQESVVTIATEYLRRTDTNPCWCDGIEGLWNALKVQWDEPDVCISKWNDSWLITTLQSILIQANDELTQNGSTLDFADKRKLENIQASLQSILLNHSNYHTLIKRGTDLANIYKEALRQVNVTPERLKEHQDILYNKAIQDMYEAERTSYGKNDNSWDSTMQLEFLQKVVEKTHHSGTYEKIKKLENWIKRLEREEYALIFDTDQGVNPWQAIQKMISNDWPKAGIVEECILSAQKTKTGIDSLLSDPVSGQPKAKILLYDTDNEIHNYNPNGIRNCISSMVSNCATVHYFIRFSVDCSNPKSEIKAMRTAIVDVVAREFAEQYMKEFGLALDNSINKKEN